MFQIIDILKDICNKIHIILWELYWYTIIYFRKIILKEIIIDGYFFIDKNLNIKHNNLGDDLNIPLIQALTGKNPTLLATVQIKKTEKLLCIGSIIEKFSSANAIIWGSGAIQGDIILSQKPQKVCALRGKLTKQYLEKQGITCPNIFGDPALLMPLVYKPNTTKKYKLGIIPHYIDYELPHVVEFREKHPEFLFIKMSNYNSYQEVITQICSCENIVSSSLHGLILSDAYGIPNVWCKFSNNLIGGEFKFKDYFSGVNRAYTPPIDCLSAIDLQSFTLGLEKYHNIIFDPKNLLRAFPYKLMPEYQRLANEE